MSDATLVSWFADDPTATIDRRAHLRDKFAPAVAIGRAVESYGAALNLPSKIDVVPCAIILENGHVLVYSCGGSGVIWVCSTDGTMNTVQEEKFALLVSVLTQLGASYEVEIPLRPLG